MSNSNPLLPASTSIMTKTVVYRPKGNSRQSVIFDPDTGIELTRHSDLWFEDGSIVCRAENVLFRVHMSQLSRHSVCFRDMFALSSSSHTAIEVPSHQPGIDTVDLNILDNCPVIFLHDKAEDVAHLFTALYDGPNFGNNDQDDFRIVSGVLRLSTKYIIDSLREKAIAHLSMAWPSTLKGWEAREDIGRSYEMATGTSSGHLYPSPIEVITLAREVDAPCLLPAAFYDLCRYPLSQVFEPNEDEPLYSPTQQGLSAFDIQRLCLGKEAVHYSITSLIQAMGSSQHIRNAQSHASHLTHIRKTSAGGICVSAAACRKDFSELVDLATQHYLFDRERGFSDPLYVADELGQLKSTEFSECKACAKSLESWAAREREKIWKMIPIWFRLESPPREGSLSPKVED